MTAFEENPLPDTNHIEIDAPTGLPKLSVEHLSSDTEEERPESEPRKKKSVTFLGNLMESKSTSNTTSSGGTGSTSSGGMGSTSSGGTGSTLHHEVRHSLSNPECLVTSPPLGGKIHHKHRSSSVYIKLHRASTTLQRLKLFTEKPGSLDTGIHTAPILSESESQFNFDQPYGSPTSSKRSSLVGYNAADTQSIGSDDIIPVTSPTPVSKRLLTTGRRSSFLYHSDADDDDSFSLKISRTSSMSSHAEETYVTPFAQILANLHKVRESFITLLGLEDLHSQAYIPLTPNITRKHPTLANTSRKLSLDNGRQLAQITLEQIDWCLYKLESVDSAKSMGGAMAQDKFRRMLTRELSHMSEGSKSGHQLAEWVQDITSSKNERDEEVDRVLHHTHGSSTGLDSTLSKSMTHDIWSKRCTKKGAKVSFNVQDYCERVPAFGVSDKRLSITKMTQFMAMEIEKWSADVFYLDDISAHNPLVCSSYHVFKRRQLFSFFKTSPRTFINFMTAIQKQYRDNPYHNRVHAADVLMTTHYLLKAKPLENVFSELEVFAALVAAAVHDVDHPGMSNQFLIETSHDLALLYNDNSVLENHHLAMAFKTMQDPTCNILESLDKQQRKAFRGMVVDMVLATDMSMHFKHLAELKNVLETKKVTNDGILELDNYKERSELLQCLIHCADLSNPAKSESLATRWSYRILEESFHQGDEEKRRGIPMNALGDREQISIEKCQVTFIDLIVYPLFETWAELVYPDGQDILDNLTLTREYWLSKMPDSPPPSSSSASNSTTENATTATTILTNTTATHSGIVETPSGCDSMIMEVDEGEEEEQEQGYYYKPDLPTQLSTDCVIPSDASERRLSFKDIKNLRIGQEITEGER